MDHDFWRERWEKNEISFHQGAPNPLFVEHFAALSLKPGARLFLPLCGKTRDIHWLLAQGFRVAGAELSRIAVEQLFEELGVAPTIQSAGDLTRFSAPGLDIFQGDVFALDAETMGGVDAVFDRAALVALPAVMRARYAPHITTISQNAPQLVICFTYDQAAMPGPPFCVSEDEMRALYGDAYDLTHLESTPVKGGLKGLCPAMETIWLLR